MKVGFIQRVIGVSKIFLMLKSLVGTSYVTEIVLQTSFN